MVFHARGNKRDLRANERNSLRLHVRTHQGAVGIIVFKEWDQRGADAHDLMRRNIHVINRFRRREDKTGVVTAGHTVAHEFFIVG